MNVTLRFVISVLLLRVVSGNFRNVAEYKLINNVLLNNYSKDVLPLIDDKKPVTVTFDLIFRSLIDVDEKNQILTFSLRVIQEWNNPLLRWDPEEHMGIEVVNLHNDLIWVPDICLYNTVDDTGSLYEKIDTAVKIDHTGNTTWMSPFLFKSECKIDVKFFPFDQQVCDLKFGSWTYDGKRIDIVPRRDKIDLTQYIVNKEWYIVDVLVQRHTDQYPCCPTEHYPSLTFTVVLKRKILFYLTDMIIPCVLIAFLAFLSFILPVECGERISLVMTVLLAMTVFLLIASNVMPPTSEVIPLVGKLYLACMVEITVCLLATFLTVKWHYNDIPMPSWIQVVVNEFLGNILWVKGTRCIHVDQCSRSCKQCQCTRKAQYKRDKGVLRGVDENSDEGLELDNIPLEMAELRRRQDGDPFVENVREYLAIMSDRVRREQVQDITCSQWKLAARVLDRFFIILFLISFLITAVVIFIDVVGSDKQMVNK